MFFVVRYFAGALPLQNLAVPLIVDKKGLEISKKTQIVFQSKKPSYATGYKISNVFFKKKISIG